MCGFCGVLGPSARAGVDDVEAMARTLAHRGPDDFGAWRTRFRPRRGAAPEPGGARGEEHGEEHEIGLGHTRLAIIDLSPLGHQPMSTEDGALTIAFNGEIYNFRELRAELEAAGCRFRSDSDTEVILHAHRTWGDGALRRLNGMFAYVLWDASRARLLLARDPVGIKPLYWSWRDGVLAFGSELRALRAHRGFVPAIDRGALGRYLRHGFVPGPESIYQGVQRLQPGDWLVWEDGDVRTGTYLRLDEPPEGPPPADYDAAVAALDALLGDAVERQMISDVPLGAFLSGGIDSSTVVALMQERSARPVRTFSIGYREARWNEAPHARAVAEHLGPEHTELTVGPEDALSVARELPRLYDEPFADASAIPTVLLSRLTRRHVTVALSGDGGDELFGGYGHYAKYERLRPWLAVPAPLRRALRPISPLAPHPSLRNVLRHLAEPDAARAAYSLISEYDGAWLAPVTGRAGAEPSAAFLEAFEHARRPEPVRRFMAADARVYMNDDVLVKVDRASMSVALEARVPILDVRVARFALSLPLAFVWQGGRTKAPLRDVLAKRVPTALVDRPKQGFGIPFHTLLAADLAAWSARYLAPARLAEEGNLDPGGVARLRATVDRHPDPRVRSQLVWRLLCFQRWFGHVHRGEPPG